MHITIIVNCQLSIVLTAVVGESVEGDAEEGVDAGHCGDENENQRDVLQKIIAL